MANQTEEEKMAAEWAAACDGTGERFARVLNQDEIDSLLGFNSAGHGIEPEEAKGDSIFEKLLYERGNYCKEVRGVFGKWVLVALALGGRAKRASWSGQQCIYAGEGNEICMQFPDGGCGEYTPTVEDLTATDWQAGD